MQWIGPRTATVPCSDAVVRQHPEDFRVTELMAIETSGTGEHLWVRVRKQNWNTESAARQLARVAGIPVRQVGFAGMKDRHAVTEQWFSLHLPGRPDPAWDRLPDGIEVLAATRHSRKLHRGALQGNRFEIVLRDLVCQEDALRDRLESIARDGVPNYFGEQRFGHDGANVEQARALFAGTARHPRHGQGILLSAARAAVFNAVLAERVRNGTWQTPLAGEACVLDGSHSFFVANEPDDVLMTRLAEHDIHLSGPLWGKGDLPTRAVVRELERAVAARHADLTAGLEAAGLRQGRRPLRVIPAEVQFERPAIGVGCIRFSLPAGCYATAVLRELAEYRVATREVEEDHP